jgi:ribosomal protein S12 methylthiotransferase accessory factor
VPIVDPRRLPRERRARVTLDDAFDWVEGWDLLAGAPVWLPLEAVTLDCVFGRRARPRLAVTSNGLASGNHLLEAIVHGLCEVIERDAEASWRRERGEARVELATVRDPICRALLDRLAAARLHVTAWDMTSDVEAPAYAAAIMEDPHEPAWRALGLYQGFGCHLSPAVALARALTEAVQTRLTYIAGSRDDLLPDDYEQSRDATLLVDIWRDVTAAPAAPVDFAERPDLSAPSFEEDVRTLLGLLSAAGAESAIVVDLTRDALGVPVAKLVVPGRAVDVDWMA